MGILLLTMSAVFTATGNLLLKYAGGFNLKSSFAYLALAAFTANIIVYSFALKYMHVSAAYMITTAISFVFIAVLAWFFFKEHMSVIQILGCLIVFLGLGLIVFGKRG